MITILQHASRLVAFATVIALAACATKNESIDRGDAVVDKGIRPTVDAPITFAGTLPCEGCPGVRFVMQLRTGGIYVLRTRYQRPDSVTIGRFDELGRWSISGNGDTLLLDNMRRTDDSRGDISVALPIIDARTLLVPEPGARPPFDTTGRTLHRADVAGFVPYLQVRGLYDVVSTPRLVECRTGLSLDVDPGASRRTLDSARSAAGRTGPTIVDIEGRLERSSANGREYLVVSRFNSILPGDTCVSLPPALSLIGPSWMLASVEGDPIPAIVGDRRPYFTLEEGGKRVGGMAGCNRFGGSATIDGPRIRFGELISTKMACDNLAIETRFMGALGRTRAWRFVDAQLELLDDGGAVLARFIPAWSAGGR